MIWLSRILCQRTGFKTRHWSNSNSLYRLVVDSPICDGVRKYCQLRWCRLESAVWHATTSAWQLIDCLFGMQIVGFGSSIGSVSGVKGSGRSLFKFIDRKCRRPLSSVLWDWVLDGKLTISFFWSVSSSVTYQGLRLTNPKTVKKARHPLEPNPTRLQPSPLLHLPSSPPAANHAQRRLLDSSRSDYRTTSIHAAVAERATHRSDHCLLDPDEATILNLANQEVVTIVAVEFEWD